MDPFKDVDEKEEKKEKERKNKNNPKTRLVCWPFCYSVPTLNEDKGTQINMERHKSNIHTSTEPHTDIYRTNFILGTPNHHSNSYYPNDGFMDNDENDCQLTPNNLSVIKGSDIENQISYETYDNINLNPNFKCKNPSGYPYGLINRNLNSIKEDTNGIELVEKNNVNIGTEEMNE